MTSYYQTCGNSKGSCHASADVWQLPFAVSTCVHKVVQCMFMDWWVMAHTVIVLVLLWPCISAIHLAWTVPCAWYFTQSISTWVYQQLHEQTDGHKFHCVHSATSRSAVATLGLASWVCWSQALTSPALPLLGWLRFDYHAVFFSNSATRPFSCSRCSLNTRLSRLLSLLSRHCLRSRWIIPASGLCSSHKWK